MRHLSVNSSAPELTAGVKPKGKVSPANNVGLTLTPKQTFWCIFSAVHKNKILKFRDF